MDSDFRKFGRGPRELSGAVDLLAHFKLSAHYDHFCKRSLPLSISDTHYLRNVAGDTEIRKGDGMLLTQLIIDRPLSRETSLRIQPFELDILSEAFRLRDMSPIDLPPSEKGTPTIASKPRSESKDKEQKESKHKDKGKEHKKHKHRHKDRGEVKEKEKKTDKGAHHDAGNDHSKINYDKKRKHGGDDDPSDLHKQKKSKHKSAKIDEMGAIKVAG